MLIKPRLRINGFRDIAFRLTFWSFEGPAVLLRDVRVSFGANNSVDPGNQTRT